MNNISKTIYLAKKLCFHSVALVVGLGAWGCAPVSRAADGPKTAVDLDAQHPSSTPIKEAQIVFFEGEAKTGVPAELDDFMTNFFESVRKDWRSGIRFMDPENYKEVFAQSPRLTPIENDASILVLSFSLHRFHGSNEPKDTDTDVQRLQAISKVHVTKVDENDQVFQIGGETALKDGRVYGLMMVVTKQPLGILCPL